MRYDWSISLSGPLNSKLCSDRQNVSGWKFWNTFKGKVCKQTKKKQTSEADIPDFQVGFFEIMEEDKRRMEENEHDEDNSTRELDDFIAAQRSSSTQKKISKRNASGKCLKGFANRR